MTEEKTTSIIPPALQNETGSLSLKKLLSKGTSPTTLVALIAALATFYSEYTELKATVQSRDETIQDLQDANHDLEDRLEEYIDLNTSAIRDRFEQDADAISDLRNAIGNLQTEVRVRHGAQQLSPPEPGQRMSRRVQIEAAMARADEAYEQTAPEEDEADPLAGLDGF